ncbi:MAG: hypothetical protein KDE19_08285 [Caldilineaceae bacterium]|nr:hypothetical protein [Caldilineaceae bacterium]
MSRLRTQWVFALYMLFALVLTWPLALHLTTHVPGDGIDDPSLAWNLWWINERLVVQHNFDIFHVDWMFYPIQINLSFYTLTPLNGLLSIPLQSGVSLMIANNLLLLSSFVLGGFGTYLLVRQELQVMQMLPARNLRFTRVPLGRDLRTVNWAAFCAGVIYAFASSKLFYASLGQFNIASSQWVPFCALYTLRLARSTTYRSGVYNAALAALFLTLQAWAELTYASFLILFVVLAFCWSLFPQRNRHHDLRAPRFSHHSARKDDTRASGIYDLRFTIYVLRLTTFALFALLFVIGIAPFLWAMVPDLLTEGDFFASGGGFADTYSADLIGYLLPTQLHPLFGDWVQQLPFAHDKGQQIFVGYTAFVLVLWGAFTLLRQPHRRFWGSFWIAMTGFFWWLTLGAEVRWLGTGTGVPGPFALISQLPFFSGNRYPSRYSVMLMLGVALLAAAGISCLVSRISLSRVFSDASRLRISHLISALFVFLFLFEHLSVPLPLSDFRVPAIYARLAAEPGDFAVLELPTGWRNGARVMGKSDILIMMQQWYQTTHGKRRLGGNTSRNPRYKFQYFTNAPLLGDLTALMNDAPSDGLAQLELARLLALDLESIIARNRPLAGEVLAFLHVKYVTVHVEKASAALLRFIDEALPLTLIDTWQGADWSGVPSTIRLYQVKQTPRPANWSIDLAAPTGTLYLAEGWSPLPWQGARYATRPCATLLLDLPEEAGTLSVEVAKDAKAVWAAVNGQSVPAMAAGDGTATLRLPLAEGLAAEPVDRLTLCTTQSTLFSALAAPPRDAGGPIGETGFSLPVSLLAQSAGYDVGDLAQIWRNGLPLLAAETGYNLVVFDASGTVVATAHYDTLADDTAADALAAFLQQWPAGTIIAGVVRDEAGYRLNQQAVDALANLGVATDLRERFRWSHAFVGVVGAEAGTALEAASLLQPATVAVGVPMAAPALYVGVKQITYSP